MEGTVVGLTIEGVIAIAVLIIVLTAYSAFKNKK